MLVHLWSLRVAREHALSSHLPPCGCCRWLPGILEHAMECHAQCMVWSCHAGCKSSGACIDA